MREAALRRYAVLGPHGSERQMQRANPYKRSHTTLAYALGWREAALGAPVSLATLGTQEQAAYMRGRHEYNKQA